MKNSVDEALHNIGGAEDGSETYSLDSEECGAALRVTKPAGRYNFGSPCRWNQVRAPPRQGGIGLECITVGGLGPQVSIEKICIV